MHTAKLYVCLKVNGLIEPFWYETGTRHANACYKSGYGK